MNQSNDRHKICQINYKDLVELAHKEPIDEFHYSLFPGFSSPGRATSSAKSCTPAEQLHIIVPLFGVMNIAALASLTTLLAFLRDNKQDNLQGVHIDVVYIGIPEAVRTRFKKEEYLPREYIEDSIYFKIIITNLIYDSTSSFFNLLVIDALAAKRQFSKLDITDLLTNSIHFHKNLEDFYGHWSETIKEAMQNPDEAKSRTGTLQRCGEGSRFWDQDQYRPPFDQIHSPDILSSSDPASTIGSIWYLIESIQRTKGFKVKEGSEVKGGQTSLLLPLHHIEFITNEDVKSKMTFAEWTKIDKYAHLITYLFPGELVGDMPYYISEAGRERWKHDSLGYAQSFLKSLTKFLGSPRYFDTEIEPASKAVELGFERLFSRIHDELRYT